MKGQILAEGNITSTSAKESNLTDQQHTDGRLTNSNLFRTCQPILIEFTMVVYEKIYLAA